MLDRATPRFAWPDSRSVHRRCRTSRTRSHRCGLARAHRAAARDTFRNASSDARLLGLGAHVLANGVCAAIVLTRRQLLAASVGARFGSRQTARIASAGIDARIDSTIDSTVRRGVFERGVRRISGLCGAIARLEHIEVLGAGDNPQQKNRECFSHPRSESTASQPRTERSPSLERLRASDVHAPRVESRIQSIRSVWWSIGLARALRDQIAAFVGGERREKLAERS